MRKLLVIFLIVLSISIEAQDLSVTDFHMVETDLTANTNGTIEFDQNGNKCALIKVETTETGFAFDVGVLGVVKTIPKIGEIWVYVPAGVKRISVFHPKLGTIQDYDLGSSLQAAKTYRLILKSAKVTVIVEEQVTQQWLVVQVKPSDAIVILEGDVLQNDGGVCTKYLKFGTYNYSIQAPDYHSISGTIQINNPENKHILNIELQPSFGYLNIPMDGLTVYLDGKVIGTSPINSLRVSSGDHSLMMTRPKFKTTSSNIVIEDNKTLTISDELVANYSQVTITGVEGSEIWINEKFVGHSPWIGELEYGSYRLECRKQSHTSSSKVFEFSPGVSTSVTMPAPTPIYGSINITSSPAISDIFLDGNHIGQTPVAINKLLIGNHQIIVKKEGYADYKQSVTILEGKAEMVIARLSSNVPVKLSTIVPNPSVLLDGSEISDLSLVSTLSLGQHTISITAADYEPFEETFTVAQNSSNTFVFSPKYSFVNHTIYVNGVCFKMIAVQGGNFASGKKNVLSSFYIGETEVTQNLWTAVMGNNPSKEKAPFSPVTNVSWYDCQEFIRTLNNLTGMNFRLPTETEWEYAASGGASSRGYKYSGGDNIESVAWYEGNSDGRYHMVKTKAPNELGIYDMSGNVWEWCSDWYGTHTAKGADPTGPSDERRNKSNRGGGYSTDKASCKVTFRGISAPSVGDLLVPIALLAGPDYTSYGNPDTAYGDTGFRLVLPKQD